MCVAEMWKFVMCWAWSADRQFLGESSWDIVELIEAKQTYLDFICCYKMCSKCLFLVNLLHCAYFILTYIMRLGSGCETRCGWQVGEGWRHIFCLLFVQMFGILVDTDKLFQTKPHPSLRELGGPIQHCRIGYRWATPDIRDECQAKSRASILCKLFIELQPYGPSWLGCMVKKVEHRTYSQSRLCKFVLGKFLRPISLHVIYSTLEVLHQRQSK